MSRSEVVELLHAGSDRKLTLLSAPAGYGKTMLLTEWRAAEPGDHLFAWLGALPEEAIAGDPPLCLVAAWLSMFAGDEEETERFLSLAENGNHTGPLLDGTGSIESGAALIRAFSVFSVAGSSRAREASRRAIELETDEASPWQAVVHLALGYSLYWSGEYSEARAPLEDAARLGEATEQPLIVVNALALLSYVEQELRHHVIAEAYAHGALKFAEENMLTYAPQVGSAHVALGKVFAARGELAQAEGHLERGLELQREVGRHPEIADALLTLAFVRRAGVMLRERASSSMRRESGWRGVPIPGSCPRC